ncbi:MAG: hypothetical protein HY735_33185 [Verrucomicrobia bacterium]|nr:hypothetical protein [Verrucomicrobiota bacterium]
MTSSPPKPDGAPNELVPGTQPNGISSSRISKSDFPELMVYAAMGDAVASSLNEFLLTFQSAPESTLVVQSMTREDFFPKFYRLANKMTDDCCQKLVKIIRSASVIPSVREAPVPSLAKRIRDTAFKILDNILAGYVGSAKKIETIHKNIKTIRNALDHPTGSPQSADPSPADPGADAAGSGGKKWATEDELVRQHQTLLHAQAQAFFRIAQYLKAMIDLPGALLSYSCDKCFAGEVNYQFERDQVAAVKAAISLKMANALETLGRVGVAARKDVEEDRANVLANIQLQQTHQALEKIWEQKMEAKLKAEQRFKKQVTTALAGLLLIIVLVVVFFAFIVAQQ